VRQNIKKGPAKKPRRYNPYDLLGGKLGVYDDSFLLDMPIVEASEDGSWATVAGPK